MDAIQCIVFVIARGVETGQTMKLAHIFSTVQTTKKYDFISPLLHIFVVVIDIVGKFQMRSILNCMGMIRHIYPEDSMHTKKKKERRKAAVLN